jgi:4-hydroxybenzoyl-CoA thioesterase
MTPNVFTVQVQFGDCGPDDIVLPHNFTRWMDAASEQYFVDHGVPPGCRLSDPEGRLCTPALELHMRFDNTVTHPDILQFHTRIDEWQGTHFVQSHRVMRGDTLIGELRETRAFCCLDDSGRLQELPVPEWVRSRCH